MSRIIGDALVAGGSLSPDAEAKAAALDALLTLIYLYGWPKGRSESGCIYDAIKALSPEALRCIEEHGASEAYKRFAVGAEFDEGA
ncbi:hypothetical protein WMF30_10740 [Sorangium sp. So ce134]